MRSIATTLMASFVAACASTGAVSIGKDTYMISDRANNGYTSAGTIKAGIYREAVAFCNKRKQQFQVVRENSVDGRPNSWNWASAELQFRCLNEGDPELARPNLKKEADVVIQNINPKSDGTAKTAPDLYAELNKLKALLDANIITQAEFDAQKRAILSRY